MTDMASETMQVWRQCAAKGSEGRVCELPEGHQGFHEFPAAPTRTEEPEKKFDGDGPMPGSEAEREYEQGRRERIGKLFEQKVLDENTRLRAQIEAMREKAQKLAIEEAKWAETPPPFAGMDQGDNAIRKEYHRARTSTLAAVAKELSAILSPER